MRIAFDTLGCKLNQAETELLARQFAEAGYRLVSTTAKSDVYILNTCTVTHIADSKSRHLLRLAHRRNPASLVVATGCYAQRAPRELARVDGVSLVVSNDEKQHLLQILKDAGYLAKPSPIQVNMVNNHDPVFRTRTSIKVQDGCNSFCTYCIMPLVRGRERSIPADRVVDEIRQRIAQGYKEVVLTGTEIGSYNYDGIGLRGLLESILSQADVTRVRLSSLQPQEISYGLLELWHDNRLCPHFHLTLQSGSDSVLNRMKRHYSTGDYHEAINSIMAVVPDAAITTDVIAGFPGETDEEFIESYEFCQQMDFARIHVFTYSPREGTEAAQMPDRVSPQVKKGRSQKMLALAEESARNFRKQFLGKTVLILWEQQSNRIWSGYTDNYIKVYTRSNEDLTNKFLPVKLEKLYKDGVWGEMK